MSDVLSSRWRISSEAAANQVGEETVILHLSNAVYYGLDAVGTSLWQGLEQGRRPCDICEKISQDYDVNIDTIRRDVEGFLEELARHNLVMRD